MSRKKKREQLFFVVLLLLLLLSVSILVYFIVQNQRRRPGTTDIHIEGYTGAPTNEEETLGYTEVIDGVKYKFNSRLRTVLLLGIDSTVNVEVNSIIGGGGRADTIILFVLDPEEKSIRMLEISRDTITTVDAYSKDREKLYSGEMQINMQFAFSDSLSRGRYLMKKKVSDLLYGIHIDNTFCMTMDGIALLVEALGGQVEITMEDDWTEIDPAYTKGAVVSLNGKELERFLRYRDDETGANNTRMSRQTWVMEQLFRKLSGLGSGRIADILDHMGKTVETDMEADTIGGFMEYTLLENARVLPGQTVAGEYHDEYHLDKEALKELVLDEFYVKAE